MKDIIAVVGPTATGKTALGVRLAKILGGEIISADSMLVYKYMDIGTAKPTEKEREGIPHHLLDLVYPDAVFTVYDYQSHAFTCIDEISQTGKKPLLIGGTGLYVQSVLDSYEFGTAEINTDFRQQLLTIAAKSEDDILHRALCRIDPASAEKIHPHDTRRIIRALEVLRATGIPISEQKKKPSYLKEKGYHIWRIGLTMKRETLYERIDKRTDRMIEEGLIEEVLSLRSKGYNLSHYSMQGLGYKQINLYIEGRITLEEALQDIKKATRQFAKRQFTWFRRDPKITWLDVGEFSGVDELAVNVCQRIKDI